MSPLGYKAALTKSFLKELKKLPGNLRIRILKAIDEIIAPKISPRNSLKRIWTLS